MEGNIRRDTLISILSEQTEPISGTELSRKLGVSRQVIVQDIALLRVSDINIISTTKGYLLYQPDRSKVKRTFKVKHTTEQIEEELCLIVDHGGRVLDVLVNHGLYGEISTDLIIRNRQDVYQFVQKVKERQIKPLKELTDGIHHHTVEADSEETLDRIGAALSERGFLYE